MTRTIMTDNVRQLRKDSDQAEGWHPALDTWFVPVKADRTSDDA